MSWIIPVLKAIGIGTATNVLSSKILGTDKQKAQIGAGTAPSLESGVPIDIAPVQGTEVQDFGAATEGFADPEIDRSAEEQQLMEDLIAAGINPEELGIVGLAFGGYLNRFGGGAIPTSNGIADLINIPELGIDPTLLEIEPPVAPDASTTMEKIEMWYNSLDPETQEALMGGGKKVGSALFERVLSGERERPGSIVSTQTLPGNSSRRRAAQMNIKPIQGSVRAADGGVLDRQMFQPSRETYMGGPMNGPGGPKDDLIPVMASNGEYMLSKAAVDAAGDGSHAMGIARLDAFNERGNKRYG
jgi:hypothetical protein